MPLSTVLFALAGLVCIFALPAIATDQSRESMFQRLSALEGTGNAEIKYNLGMFLNNGIGTSRDNKAAFRYFSEAADGGNELAAYKVGCYYAGQFSGVVPFSEDDAMKFKLRAADAGYDLAQHDVAMHFSKKGDITTALVWFERASRQANLPSTAALANYLSGDSSPDKAKGLALMLILKDRMPNTSPQLDSRIAAVEGQLNTEQKMQANLIRSSWLTGPTPLTSIARSGISTVPALLKANER